MYYAAPTHEFITARLKEFGIEFYSISIYSGCVYVLSNQASKPVETMWHLFEMGSMDIF